MPKPISNTRRYPGAGYLTLIKHRANGTDSTDPKDIYTSGRVVMGVVNTSYNTTQTPLEDENSPFPAANYTTGNKSTLSVGFNTKDPRLLAFLKGANQSTPATVGQWFPNLERTVQADAEPATKGSVVLKDGEDKPVKILESRPVLVRDTFGNIDFKEVTSASPQKGEFKVDRKTGAFTFAKDDVGTTVFISCEIEVADATVYELDANPKVPTFTAILSGPDQDHNESDPKWVTETYDCVQPSGDINDMPRQKAPGSWTATFETVKPRPGRKTVTTVYGDPLLDPLAFA